MPPTDSTSADTGTAPVTDIGGVTTAGDLGSPVDKTDDTDADTEDTLDLGLPEELLALLAETSDADGGRNPGYSNEAAPSSALRHSALRPSALRYTDDLLDTVADWGPISTPAGLLHLVPVGLVSDLPLVSRWMNDPAVAAFWGLAGPPNVTEAHLRSQLAGDGRSVPCLGMLEGTPMSYWEIYRADLDPLARHYPARPHDTGLHVLIGAVGDRGRGLGGTLLRAVADLVLDRRPACARVVAEPDMRNTPSVAAFLSAGFRFSAEIELPAKRAALMVRDRTLRHLL
ncbi:GNAT family N-acetyltransferase [Streptomyces sp. NPDC007808]|uniref:GNAT family N-acetyltransferase n=1 Tax=Streptomyces sp. NPDC007808 TaxID=3364779 RepID=UPI003699FF37